MTVGERARPPAMDGTARRSTRSGGMSDTKSRTKSSTATRTALGSTTRTNAVSTVARPAAASKSSRRSSASSLRSKVPSGKLLSIPEKKARGIITDERIDDAEEKRRTARPRRPRPDRRPSIPAPTSAPRDAPFGIRESRLLELDAAMRAALRHLHSVSRDAKTHLSEAFADVDEHDTGRATWQDFRLVWAYLGVDLDESECRAWCRRCGGGEDGASVEYAVFIDRMIRGAARADATDVRVCRGYPVSDEDFRGKIAYPRCRSTVSAPPDFDVALADRSTLEPDASLILERVHGYEGARCHAPNLFYAGDGSMAYYAAAIGIVRDAATGAQRHFGGHTREITCMSMCAAETTLDGVTYPPLTLAATGQRKAVEDTETDEAEVPFVCVWDTRTCREVARVRLSESSRAVAALGFSPDGAALTTVGCDDNHTVHVWDWRARGVGEPRARGGGLVGLIGQGAGFKERPTGVYGVKWDPRAPAGRERFCTWGKKHVKMWTEDPVTRRWSSRAMSFGEYGVEDILAVEFLKPPPRRDGGAAVTAGIVVGGCADGSLLLWRNGRAFRRVRAHARGPRTIQPDGTVAWGGGVRALRLRPDVDVLLTGGADGAVAQWDASDGALGERITEPVPLADPSTRSSTKGVSSLAIRAIDCASGSDVILVGTSSCDAWTVNLHPESESTRVVVKGHASRVRHACWHPRRPDVFFTACESGEVCARDATRAETRVARVGFAASAIAVTRDAVDGASHHVAVAGTKGEIAVLDERTLEVLHATRAGRSCVADLKYSPDGSRLAAATREGATTLFAVAAEEKGRRAYRAVARLEGHSAAVRHVDWSEDSSALATDGADYELLYWDAKTGRLTTEAPRDARWAEWTRALGFPVMGVWAPESDGTDVNATHADPDGRLLVTADDRGEVKLFAFPCVVEGAGFKSYRGHASFVECARFAPDGERVVTAGGRDGCAFQYRVARDAPSPDTPPPPTRRWLPLDASGKSYGFRDPDPEPEPARAERIDDAFPGEEKQMAHSPESEPEEVPDEDGDDQGYGDDFE